jgi:FKBP-type peptidyl-prolyl cis-trans isomerase FkpA
LLFVKEESLEGNVMRKELILTALAASLIVGVIFCAVEANKIAGVKVTSANLNSVENNHITAGEEQMFNKITDGLHYKIITPGQEGKEAATGDKVLVHYTGRFADPDGNIIVEAPFDSSHNRVLPFEFTLGAGRVIQGWDKGVVGMKIGEKRRLLIAPQMGYGFNDYSSIPANSTLLFDVELLQLNK